MSLIVISFVSVVLAKPIVRAAVVLEPIVQTPITPVNPKFPINPSKPGLDRITNIGNGGGLAEMRFIYLHQNLDRFLKICLSEQKTCGISEETKAEWQSLSVRQAKDAAQYVISFLPKVESEKGYVLKDHELTISSQMLYLDMETPKKFGQILAFLVAVRQDIAGSKNSFANNLSVATNVFANLRVEESLYRATGIPALLRLAQLKVSDGTQQAHFLFSIEDTNKTIDLTQSLSQALPCGKLSDWSFSQWNSSIASTAYFYGYASGQCDGVWQQKRIVIEADLKQGYIIDENRINIQFFLSN
ncbi:MAG: hypothetical protein H7256_10885 [Bdellovibrio sp.]|nr:hypothetical protein [Bdellovibrio sp.]